jgi:hypothetical protein
VILLTTIGCRSTMTGHMRQSPGRSSTHRESLKMLDRFRLPIACGGPVHVPEPHEIMFVLNNVIQTEVLPGK